MSTSAQKRAATSVPRRGSGKRGQQPRPVNRQRRATVGRQARRRRNQWAGVSVTAVVAIVAAVVVIGLTVGGSGSKFTPRTPAEASVVTKVTSVPVGLMAAAMDQVASSSSPLEPAIQLGSPGQGGGAGSSTPLTSAGKPQLLFIGAEFCPICATERWAMVAALSKFGTFTGLSQIRSANRDGDIATFSFYGSHYTSPYLTFTPVEAYTNQPTGPSSYKPLQTLTAAQMSLWESTLAEFGQNPGYPFIDIGGKYLLYSSQIPDTTLAGLDWTQISADVGDNNTTVGAGIDASAGALVKYICAITGNKPAATCSAMASANAPVEVPSSAAAASPSG